MTQPSWWKPEVTPGNVVSWAVSIVGIAAVVVWLQADVRALQSFRDEARGEIAKMKDQRALDREALLDMKGDIRVIRQILEQRPTK